MFEVKRLDDTTKQARTGENLKLRVEVNRIVAGTDDVRRLAYQGSVVFKINLHARAGLVNIGFARHVDHRKHSD